MSIPRGTILSFYEIDARILGGDRYFFFNGLNEFQEDVIWSYPVDPGGVPEARSYMAFPIEATGFEFKGDGGLPRPSVAIANVNQYVGKLTRFFRDLKGCLFIRRQVFGKYLDAANFVDGNPEADPLVAFPPDIYIIDRKTHEDRQVIKFECVSPLDLSNVVLPGRPCSATVCPWTYKSEECGYVGSLPTCDKGIKTANGCEVHFGAGNTLRAGSFPGVGRNRR